MKEPKFKVGDEVYFLHIDDEYSFPSYGIGKNRIIVVCDPRNDPRYTEVHYWIVEIETGDDVIEIPESMVSATKEPIINRIVELLKNENS